MLTNSGFPSSPCVAMTDLLCRLWRNVPCFLSSVLAVESTYRLTMLMYIRSITIILQFWWHRPSHRDDAIATKLHILKAKMSPSLVLTYMRTAIQIAMSTDLLHCTAHSPMHIYLSPNSITLTFTKTSPWGKSRTHIMKVANANGDKSWNHEVLVKVADINHESHRHKQSRHVETWDVCDKVRDKSVTKSVTSPRQTRLRHSNEI